jgi:DNA-binding NtrC family response regulator
VTDIVLTLADLETAVPLNAALEQAGFSTELVAPVDDARATVRRARPDLVVITGAVHEAIALDLVTYAKELEAYTLALLEPTDSERTERIERLGATALMTKPIAPVEAVAAVRRLVDRRRLQQRIGIIGQSGAIYQVLVKIEQMAPVTSTVLIQGESGTGKELVAKALHDLSGRRGRPFIPVNCAALPETLLESELFGHEKGSFTGAAERRLGRFELADTGTIFLDEIGDVPPTTQVKLLRVLETRTFFRVGGTQPIKVDVRVVAATNKALKESVAMGEFREDLYYRLSVLNIDLVPLRERREDIPLLVRRFIREFASQHDRQFRGITPEALHRLTEAHWPGNVRQLRNLIESMVVLAPGAEIRAADIPAEVLEGAHTLLPVLASSGHRQPGAQEFEFILRSLMDLRLQVEELRRRLDERPSKVQVIEIPETSVMPLHEVMPEPAPSDVLYRPGMTMADVEKATISAALKESRGNRRQAAAKLGIGERTLYRKIKEFGLD